MESSQDRDLLEQIGNMLESELRCGVCSELMVFVSHQYVPYSSQSITSSYHFCIGHDVKLHAHLLPILHQAVEEE